MPQKRQAAKPDAVAKPHVHKEHTERRIDTYPAAPTDPRERQDWMRRRNARISGVDEDEYMEALAAQDGRAIEHLDQQRPNRHT